MADNYELETINIEGKTVWLTDKQLTDRFNAEVTNRENADTALQGQITAEVTNRENADTALQNNIDAEATARQSDDNTLQGNINSEAATRASADSNLQSQINQIIAPSGEAPSAAEVQNARIGTDGIVYTTLGAAIRNQVGDLDYKISKSINPSGGFKNLCYGDQMGKYWVAWNNGDTVTLTDQPAYVAATVLLGNAAAITLNHGWADNSHSFFADANNKRIGLVRDYQISGVDYVYNVPSGAVFAYISQNISSEPSAKYYQRDGIVVFEGNTSINGQVTVTDFPYGKTSGVTYHADNLHLASADNKKLSEIITPLVGLQDVVIKSTATVYRKSDFPDYNDAPDNSMIMILYPASTPSADLPAHYPTDEVIRGISQLFTYLSSDKIMKVQAFRNAVQGITYTRMWTINNGWQEWHSAEPGTDPDSKKYTCLKDGSGDFTSLVTAINTVSEIMDAELFVGPGTWDIIDELGTNYMNAVSSASNTWGLVLKNRIRVVCSSNSLITAKYTGNNANVRQYFSAFNAGVNGFTLENANIETDNTRYTVHDDRGADGGEGYFNRYINCSMRHTNGMYSDCIGGGLGTNGMIEIKDCYFEGDPEDSRLVYYHGNNFSGQTNAQCKIVVTGNYFAGIGTFGLTKYGDSTKVSTAYVSNNSVGSPLFVNSGSYAPQDNMRMIAWNNEIRSNT